MEWARERIDIVILSKGSSASMKKIGSCKLANTLPFHSLYDILQLLTDLGILVELRLEMLEDSRAKHAFRREV